MSGLLLLLITTIHVVACIALMASILLQSGKGGGLAGAFGAGSSQTLFGGRGAASFLSRATTVLSVIFFLTSLTLGISASKSGGKATTSLIQEEAKRRSQQGPTEGAQAPARAPATAPGTPGGPAALPPVAGPRVSTSAAPSAPAPPAPAGTTTK